MHHSRVYFCSVYKDTKKETGVNAGNSSKKRKNSKL